MENHLIQNEKYLTQNDSTNTNYSPCHKSKTSSIRCIRKYIKEIKFSDSLRCRLSSELQMSMAGVLALAQIFFRAAIIDAEVAGTGRSVAIGLTHILYLSSIEEACGG